MKGEQLELLCLTCILKACDEQSLHCRLRLFTNPNWMQKRKIADDKKREAKRAKESGRTKYWREYAAKKRAELASAD